LPFIAFHCLNPQTLQTRKQKTNPKRKEPKKVKQAAHHFSPALETKTAVKSKHFCRPQPSLKTAQNCLLKNLLLTPRFN
jgi:hypothetical protein